MMFKKISPYEAQINPFETVGKQWMLITAGDAESCNTMTASWGGLGVLWNMPVATCYIRPQRYTREFIDREEYFSLSFFGAAQREALTLCGRVSGRDCAKITDSGLTVLHDRQAPYFEQAKQVLICRKLYRQLLEPACFIDGAIEKHYPEHDYHYMYIGEIVECLQAE